jgi:serine/threonine protein kinase
MAPEQARGDSALDHRADLWAVGVILYQALTGQRPFVGNNYNALLVQILTASPRPLPELLPQVPQVLCDLVRCALAKARSERFQSARAFASAIESAIEEAQRLCGQEGITPLMWQAHAQEETEVMSRRFRDEASEMTTLRDGMLGEADWAETGEDS